jgi:hypothetical protein
MRQRSVDGSPERGQILVLFALALVAIVAMAGLVLDGGSAFVQRRSMQNVADSSAMAAAYTYGMGGTSGAATTAARATAASNGFVHGTGGVSVDVTMVNGNPARFFTVQISGPHANNFAGIVGMPTWQVATTATAQAGRPNGVIGALPVIFNEKAFDENGSGHEVAYDEPDPGNEDVPVTATKFNWTEFCNECNADSNTVRALIIDHGGTQVVSLDDHISPLNAGSHTTLFDALAELVGQEFAVPIVNDDGVMMGFATFHLTGSVGGSTKQIRGYFVSPINPTSMMVVANVDAGCDCGSYVVKLTN